VSLLSKIYDETLPPFTDVLMEMLRRGKVSIEDISYYLACVNPRLYGKYFSLSHRRLNHEVVKKCRSLLPEIRFSRLTNDEKKETLKILQDHADIFSNYIVTGTYLRKESTPFLGKEVYFRNGNDVIAANRHILITRLCDNLCSGDDNVKECVEELSSFLHVEKTLHSYFSFHYCP
jgi:hypothetical protein